MRKEGIEQWGLNDETKLLKNSIIYSMLSYKMVSVNFISQFTRLDKSTIQRDLETQLKVGRIIRRKNSRNKREYLYGIKMILRACLERTLMQKMEERIELIG